MERRVLFYCLVCNELMSVERADMLFRTGYYRTVYPLGCCAACKRAATS